MSLELGSSIRVNSYAGMNREWQSAYFDKALWYSGTLEWFKLRKKRTNASAKARECIAAITRHDL